MPSSTEDGSWGGVAAEIVQTTLDHFGEPTIAGKTHSEILVMSRSQRYRWYKKITFEEKAEAMQIVDVLLREKRVVITNKRWKLPESRAKISEGLKKYWEDSEHRAKRSTMMSGEYNPMKKPEVRARRSGEGHPAKRPEARTRMSEWSKKQWEDSECRKTILQGLKIAWNSPERIANMSGLNAPNWQGGISFEPYCPKFNEQLKEKIRNRDNRVCVLCGKSEILNGRYLSVHHIDGDKLQGCSGKRWALVSLCKSCHSKLHGTRGQKAIELEFLIVTGGRSVL